MIRRPHECLLLAESGHSRLPDELVTAFARYRAANPASRLVGAHLFAFGGLEPSARWLNAVQAGRFTLNEKSTGFELWPE